MARSVSAHVTNQGNCILTWVNWDGLGVNHRDGVWLGSRGMVWGRLGVVWFRGMGHSLVLDVSNVSVLVVGVVGDDLRPAVGEGNTVLAGNNTIVILQSDKNQSSMNQKIGTQTYFGIDFRLGFVK